MDDFTVLGIGGIMALAIAITKFVMHVSADWFDKKRFAPLVSLASGVVASVLWQLAMPDTTMKMAIIRGVIIGFSGSGLWDNGQAFKAIVGRGGSNG